MKKICIYGKGGIGKSTAVANLAAAMAETGKRVAVVGCDPKADSTRNLTGRRIPTVLECMQTGGRDIAVSGFRGIRCMEAGGPEPGTGCAGRGIAVALDQIRQKNLLEDTDAVIFDVLGDVVCGGFSMPLRESIAEEVYLVTTSDYMSLYAANNICRGIRRYAKSGVIRLSGFLYNGRSGLDNRRLAEEFARKLGSEVIGGFAMSEWIAKAEMERKTVIERYPDSEISESFRRLAGVILNTVGGCIPMPMSDEEVEVVCMQSLLQ